MILTLAFHFFPSGVSLFNDVFLRDATLRKPEPYPLKPITRYGRLVHRGKLIHLLLPSEDIYILDLDRKRRPKPDLMPKIESQENRDSNVGR